MVHKKGLITFGAFISMSFIGMSRTFLGTALPAIRSSFDLNILQAGTLTALLQLGFSIAVLVGGPISDIFKKQSVLLLGCLLIGINLILFGFSEWFWINLFGITLIGIGGGLIESSSNPLLIQFFPGRESMVLNLHHFFFALGSLTGPLIMGAVLVRAIPWQWAYAGFGLFALSIFLFLLLQKSSASRKKSSFETKQIKSLLGEKTFLLLFFVTFFNSGVQNGITFWMVTFLKDVKGLPISLASYSLFTFFACLALGRLFSSYLITRFHETTYLLGLLLLLLIGLFFAISSPGKWSIPFFALCGFGHSGVFPSLLGMTGKIYSKLPGTAMGILAAGGGLGSVVIPWLMSLVSQMTTLNSGFLSFEIFVILCILLMGILVKDLKKRTVLASH
jgi:FHS family glucose/mannose:H+ symporter-like MFS transporter